MELAMKACLTLFLLMKRSCWLNRNYVDANDRRLQLFWKFLKLGRFGTRRMEVNVTTGLLLYC
jgi:hypothetical protein